MNGASGGVTGGREGNLTFGVNWYPVANWRFTVNAVFGHVSHQGNVGFLQTRLQYDF